jgi:hypothetical protein
MNDTSLIKTLETFKALGSFHKSFIFSLLVVSILLVIIIAFYIIFQLVGITSEVLYKSKYARFTVLFAPLLCSYFYDVPYSDLLATTSYYLIISCCTIFITVMIVDKTPLVKRKLQSLDHNKEDKLASCKELECAICLQNQINMACLPCGHASTCISCSKKYFIESFGIKCHVCRGNVDGLIKIFVK